jgi:chemotaxis response regulator CheB
MARRRILVADDNALMRKVLGKMFSEHPTLEVCEEAQDGQQAVEKAANCDPDLIILDLSMPILNGLEAARIIRAMLPAVPIILFTQHATVFENPTIDRGGVSRIISKMEMHSLAGCAEELLGTVTA